MEDNYESNLSEWVSQYPQQVKIIRNPKLIHLFKKSPPPRDKEDEVAWLALKKMIE